MGLNDKEQDIIDLLTVTNEKLDTIITALGALTPTATATLDDLLTALNAISTTSSSMDASLQRIRDAISPLDDPVIGASRSSISWAIYRIMLSTALPWAAVIESDPYREGIWDIVGRNLDKPLTEVDAHITDITDLLVRAALNIGLDPAIESQDYTGYLHDVLDWLGRASGALGLPVEANNRDIIQLLAKEADRPESQIGSGLAPYDICTDAYVSTGMTIVPFNVLAVLTAIVFAIFDDPPPSGITYGSDFGIGVDNTELHIEDDNWSGWSIYVASSANNFALNGSDISSSLARYATNVWIDISFLNTNLSVFVNGTDSIRVYLCPAGWGPGSGGGGPWGGGSTSGGPFPPSWTECVTISSVPGTYSTDAPYSLDLQVIRFNTLPGVSTTNSWFGGGNNQEFNVANTVITDNCNGVTVTLISGSNVTVAGIEAVTGNGFSLPLGAPSDSQTVTTDTTVLVIANFSASSPATSPFTIEICPAGV